MDLRQYVATENEILRGVVGSTAHGTAIDGQDDRDEMGVFIEPPLYVCGMTSCDHYIHRDQPEGVRSQPGDLDLTMYSLRKFCRLAHGGNPSILILLWLSEYLTITPLGNTLVVLRDAFISRRAGQAFLGYLTAQKHKLQGRRAHNVNRPEMVAKYGFDVKFAMHALRLGFEGIELMTERCLTLPVPEPKLAMLRAVRKGEISLSEVLALIEHTEAALGEIVDRCDWQPDTARINNFLVYAHNNHWSSRFSSTAERSAVDGETEVRLF